MVSIVLIFLSGLFEGVMDTLHFHYKRFEKKHPKIKDKFWNPEYSWLNKYDEQLKPKFFLSTTALVFLTDGYHLMKFLRNIFLFASIAFAMYKPIELNIIVFVFILYGINRIGFNFIYNNIYK